LPENNRTFCRKGVGGSHPCPNRSRLQSESVGHAPYRCWGPPDCRYRWRVAHRREPVGRQRICRRRTPEWVTKSLSMRRRSLTSAWRRSMSSTRKTSEHPGPTCNLPEKAAKAATPAEAAEAARAAEAATAEAADAVAAAAVEAVAEAAGGGGSALADGAIDIARSPGLGLTWPRQEGAAKPTPQRTNHPFLH
jgi:hypothetical protein